MNMNQFLNLTYFLILILGTVISEPHACTAKEWEGTYTSEGSNCGGRFCCCTTGETVVKATDNKIDFEGPGSNCGGKFKWVINHPTNVNQFGFNYSGIKYTFELTNDKIIMKNLWSDKCSITWKKKVPAVPVRVVVPEPQTNPNRVVVPDHFILPETRDIAIWRDNTKSWINRFRLSLNLNDWNNQLAYIGGCDPANCCCPEEIAVGAIQLNNKVFSLTTTWVKNCHDGFKIVYSVENSSRSMLKASFNNSSYEISRNIDAIFRFKDLTNERCSMNFRMYVPQGYLFAAIGELASCSTCAGKTTPQNTPQNSDTQSDVEKETGFLA